MSCADVRPSVVAARMSLEYQTMGATPASSSALVLARARAQYVRRTNMKVRSFERAGKRAEQLKHMRLGQKTNKLIGKYFRIQMMQ